MKLENLGQAAAVNTDLINTSSMLSQIEEFDEDTAAKNSVAGMPLVQMVSSYFPEQLTLTKEEAVVILRSRIAKHRQLLADLGVVMK